MPGCDPVVLCVEDEVFVRMFVCDALSDAGYEVLEAGSAAEALSILERRSDIQALVTDVDMPPGMNGFALAQRVREHWSRMPIVVLSGRYAPGPGDLPAGAIFLAKPISEVRLVEEVNRAVEGEAGRMRRQLGAR